MPGSSVGTVLITGGSSGLGAAATRAVAGAGGRPLVIDRVTPPDTGDYQVDYELADLADRAAASRRRGSSPSAPGASTRCSRRPAWTPAGGSPTSPPTIGTA